MNKKTINPTTFVLATLIMANFLLIGAGILIKYSQGRLSIDNWPHMIINILFLTGVGSFLIR